MDGAAAPARVAVVPLFYGRTDVIDACLGSLIEARSARPFDIYAIENPSEHSDVNRARINEAVRRGEVAAAYLPSENAIFNAMLFALTADVFGLRGRYDYIVLSDGDIGVAGDFVSEQIALLDANPRMSSASLRMDIRRWDPRSARFPAAMVYGASAVMAERAGKSFFESAGGFWMRMFRAEDAFRLAEIFDLNGFRLRDGQIDNLFRTMGMFPGVTLKSQGVELPQGPLFHTHDATKRKAEAAALQRPERYIHLWNHDLVPGGVVIDGEGERAPADDRPALLTTCSPEVHRVLADAPLAVAGALAAFDRAEVLTTLDWSAPPVGLVLAPDPRMQRTIVGPDGAWAVAPFAVLEGEQTLAPFLDEIRFDTREVERIRRGVLGRLFAIAARVLRPEGSVVIEAVDLAQVSHDLAINIGRLETALRAGARADATLARTIQKRARLFARRDLMFDLGEIALAAGPHGFEIAEVERAASTPEAPSVVYRLRRGAIPVSAG